MKKENSNAHSGSESLSKATTQIFSEDLSEEMRKQALEISQQAFFQNSISHGKVYSTIASRIRNGLEKQDPSSGSFTSIKGKDSVEETFVQSGWNCIVGKSFGSCVTHEMKKYM